MRYDQFLKIKSTALCIISILLCLKKVGNDSVRIDFIHDIRHLCTRFWTDGIKAMSRGNSGVNK